MACQSNAASQHLPTSSKVRTSHIGPVKTRCRFIIHSTQQDSNNQSSAFHSRHSTNQRSARKTHLGSSSLKQSHFSINYRDYSRRTVFQLQSASSAAIPGGSADGRGSSQEFSASAYLRVILPTAMALLLCNMDRICLSVAILPMATEFGWAEGTQGLIQSAFLWGYMATQLIGGTLADQYGGKLVMGAGVLSFSIACALLPLTLSDPIKAAGLTLPAVLLARCCVGLGEGVTMPSMNSMVATYIPPKFKATALGNIFTGFHCGNLVGILLSPLLVVTFGWRSVFFVFGLLGVPLLLMWSLVVPDHAPRSPAASAQASKLSVFDLMSKAPTWAIIIINFINHWGYFIYLNWMPSYFAKTFGVDLKASGLLAFVPWLVMAVGSSLSGLLADRLIAGGMDVTRVRKGVQTVAFLFPALALVLLSSPSLSPELAVLYMTAALGTTSLGQAGFVANMSDIAPGHAGKMFGLCNTFGSLAGIMGVVTVGLIVEKTGSFSNVFMGTAAMYVVGALVWNLMCTGKKVFD